MSEDTLILIWTCALAAIPHACIAAVAFSEDRDQAKRAIAYLRQHPELCQQYRDSPKQLLKVARQKLKEMEAGRL